MAPNSKTDDAEPIAADVRYDEGSDAYELGAEIDGTFYAFHSVPGPQVRDRVATAKANAEAASDEPES